MERTEFMRILSPLVLGMRVEFDTPTWRAYYAALRDVPPALLQGAVEARLRSAHEFFPKAGELRAACETHRQALVAQRAYLGCEACEWTPGWVADPDRANTVTRCACWHTHRAALAEAGLASPVGLEAPLQAADEDRRGHLSPSTIAPAVHEFIAGEQRRLDGQL